MEETVTGGSVLSRPWGGVLELDPSLYHPALLRQQAVLRGLVPLSSAEHGNTIQLNAQSLGLQFKGIPGASHICSKEKSAGTSNEDEPGFTDDDGDDPIAAGKIRENFLWQRMKWTDSMVKLLINVVRFVEQDVAVESNDGSRKGKPGTLQKKGKWKTVSRLMMERGCYVSPQQCEDKFNDLNKRYKHLNDTLGKGTACFVGENSSLFNSVGNLSPRAKEGVKKIPGSKHLLYKETCSYHTGRPQVLDDLQIKPFIQAEIMSKSKNAMVIVRPMKAEVCSMDNDNSDADCRGRKLEVKEEECNYNSDKQITGAVGLLSTFDKCRKPLKYSEAGICGLLPHHAMKNGVEHVSSDLMTARTIELQEQKVRLQAEAIEFKKQFLKWQKASKKRNWELERMKLDNEEMRLENEQMSFQLKQKKLKIDLKRSEALMASVMLILNQLQSKGQDKPVRGQQT
eukprot:c20405_g1_i1 orf=1312-2676(+)